MRKGLSTFALFAMLLVMLSLVASAQEQTTTLTGWVSDSNCLAKGTTADHRDCALKCVKEKGAKWVFVNSENKNVLNIHNQEIVNTDTDLGKQVKATGHLMKDGSIHIESITPST